MDWSFVCQEPIKLKFHEGALLPVDAVPDDGRADVLRKVCVAAAVEAARLNVPFNRQKSFPNLVFKEAETALGRRPSKHEIKNAMEEAVRLGELSYRHNFRMLIRGPDEDVRGDLAP
jgi:hypothetical protein